MPNAKDFKGGNEKFMVIGHTGTGKTKLFTTIPGKKFMYIFDPNALNTIAGEDIDYEIFTPDVMNMKVVSLTKGIGDKSKVPIEPQTYLAWEEDFEKKIADGFFDNYDAIGFDSMTTFCDLVMDRVLYINGRFGKQPEQPDWSAQINTIKNVFRQATSLDLILYVTVHKDLKQDDLTKRVEYQICLPGQLRNKLPLLFSEVWNCSADSDKDGNAKSTICPRPDKRNTIARSTLCTEEVVDVTVPANTTDPTKYGIGKLIKEHPRNK